MNFLMKVSSFFLKVGAVADKETLLETKALTYYGRDIEATAQLDKEQRATTIKSFFILLVVSLSLFTFLGCVIVRSNNPRLLNNGNIEGEQPDEEQQVLIGNTAAAETNTGNDEHVIFQQNRFEIEENGTNTGHNDQAHHRRHWLYTLEAKCNFGTRFAIINFLMEIPSAVLDEIASEEKPNYVLIVMLISLTSMLVCLVELVYKGRKEKITWRWSSGRIPWFYYPPPPSNRPFGTFTEIIGLVCAMAQCIVSAINYYFCLQDHAAPIKFSVWRSIFSFGLLCSRFMGDPNDEGGESRTSDQDGGDVALNQAILEPLTIAELQQ